MSSRMPGGATEGELADRLRRLCSEATVFTRKDGFFPLWLQEVKAQLSEDFMKAFGQLKTDEDRIVYLWSTKSLHTLNIRSFYTGKNRQMSEDKRTEGNKAFQEKKNEQALLLYSQAVNRAPPDEGNCLSLAYANRSAVLFYTGEYELCRQDIHLALQHGYPENLKYKVYQRSGRCFLEEGQFSKAKNEFEQSVASLASSELDMGKRETWRQQLEDRIKSYIGREDAVKKAKVSSWNVTLGDQPVPEAELFQEPSTVLPNASSAVGLAYSPDAGRFAVAVKDIPAGKVVVKEKPFSSVLMPSKRGLHCSHCFKRLIAPIPCLRCSAVTFCNIKCRDAALETYHHVECRFLDLLHASGMSLNCYLALRIISERGLNFFKQAHSKLQEQTTLMPSAEKPHNPNDYLSFYYLEALENDRDPHDFLQRTLMAMFLLKMLQVACFFGPWDEDSPSDADLTQDELLIGSLLLRHIQVIQFNAHEVSGMAYDGEVSVKNSKSVFLGLAVYPTVSFFNHSCYPAVTRYFESDKMIIVTIRPLKKGDILAENYGPIFTHHLKEERQKKMQSRYWFRCSCEACEGNWPIYTEMSSSVILKCEKCGQTFSREHIKVEGNKQLSATACPTQKSTFVTCKNCSSNINLTEMTKTIAKARECYVTGQQLMDDGKREDAIDMMTKYVNMATPKVVLPLKDLHLAMQALRLLIGSRGTSYLVMKG